jgi:hypothetical protein
VIIGYVGRSDGRPLIDAMVTFPDYHGQSLLVTFIIDTGSPATIIGEEDTERLAIRLGLPTARIGKADTISGFGGLVEARYVRGVLTLTDENSAPWTKNLYPFLLPMDPGSNLTPVPSVLGTDVLRELPLFLDFQRHIVQLHN